MIDPQIPMRLGEEVDQLRAENERIREELAKETEAKLRLITQCADQLEELAQANDYANRKADEKQKLVVLLAAAQAKIDSLMLEYCPNEMTPEQMDNWAKHQQQAELDEALLANLKEQQ